MSIFLAACWGISSHVTIVDTGQKLVQFLPLTFNWFAKESSLCRVVHIHQLLVFFFLSLLLTQSWLRSSLIYKFAFFFRTSPRQWPYLMHVIHSRLYIWVCIFYSFILHFDFGLLMTRLLHPHRRAHNPILLKLDTLCKPSLTGPRVHLAILLFIFEYILPTAYFRNLNSLFIEMSVCYCKLAQTGLFGEVVLCSIWSEIYVFAHFQMSGCLSWGVLISSCGWLVSLTYQSWVGAIFLLEINRDVFGASVLKQSIRFMHVNDSILVKFKLLTLIFNFHCILKGFFLLLI